MHIQNEELIKKWEKLRLKAYKPTVNDVWTIGWGHTKGVTPSMQITKEQAQKFFREDVAWVEDFLNKAVKVPLNQNQYDALASWVFNIGAKNAGTSTLIRKLNAKDYEGAALELPRWNKQKGKTLAGLTKRRSEEMGYFLNGAGNIEPLEAVPEQVPPMKSLTTSKEAIGGLLVALLGSGIPLLEKHIDEALLAVSVSLVILGGLLVANRIYARVKGIR